MIIWGKYPFQSEITNNTFSNEVYENNWPLINVLLRLLCLTCFHISMVLEKYSSTLLCEQKM